MDEVDMVLHPLKSEQNFPTGEKESLDLATPPLSLRIKFPMHMIDVFFFARKATEGKNFVENLPENLKKHPYAASVLSDLNSALKKGEEVKHIMAKPHDILLRDIFYF